MSGDSDSHPIDELTVVALHVLLDELSHLLVEATEKDGTDENGHVETHRGKETGDFEGNIRRADDANLWSRGLLLGENVIRGHRELATRAAEDSRPASDGDEDLISGDTLVLGLIAWPKVKRHSVVVGERTIGINVLDLLGPQVGLVAVVEGGNVILDLRNHLVPVVLFLFGSPAEPLSGLDVLAVDARLMHELLWNATHVDAGTTEPPFASERGWDDVV